jgi:magnesium-transporting ATPase (P-type)
MLRWVSGRVSPHKGLWKPVLQRMQPALATVVRNGHAASMEASQLVPGDVLEIRVGNNIPAHARLVSLQSSSMQVDEGSLMGESVTVSKLPGDEGTMNATSLAVQDQRGMLYSGTMVTSGSVRAVVVQKGMASQMGKIQKGVTDAKDSQPKTQWVLWATVRVRVARLAGSITKTKCWPFCYLGRDYE